MQWIEIKKTEDFDLPIITRIVLKEVNFIIKNGNIKIFAGPLKTNDGKDIIPSGKELDDGALWGMNYYLQGVTGKVPK